MNAKLSTVRLLGVAQLIVIIGNLIMDTLLSSAIGSGTISSILLNISGNLTEMRISNLVSLGQTFAIIVLGVLYYVVFFEQHKTVALVSLICFVMAASTIAVSKMATNALIPLSQEFVKAGTPESSIYQALADLLYFGVDRRGNDIHMLFLGLGFLLTNYLFYISREIPRAISTWGIVAICLLLIPTVFVLFDREFVPGAMILALPYAPY